MSSIHLEIEKPGEAARFEVHRRTVVDHPGGGVVESYQHILSVPVYGSDSFVLGRSKTSCRGVIPSISVSARHLKVHSILYEDDEGKTIPPLVYVRDISSNGTLLKKLGEHELRRLVKSEPPTLLNHGDVLLLGDQTVCIFRILGFDGLGPELTAVQKAEVEKFGDRYKITDQVLGFGSQGSVFVAVHFRSRRQLACKVLPINPPLDVDGLVEMCPSKSLSLLKNLNSYRELDILKNLKHPNIIGLQKVFWSKSNLYIFQDLVTGGDLFSYFLSRDQKLQPTEAGLIALQIAKGVEYLHGKGIVHRDLKLENILMTAPERSSRVVIADFGYARYLPRASQGRMRTVVGTIDYSAPEIFQINKNISAMVGYSKAVDMWAVGVISFMLLFGRNPFARTDSDPDMSYKEAVIHSATICDLAEIMDHPQYLNIGEKPRDFVQKLLVIEERKRMTARAAVSHSWFTDKNDVDFDVLYDQVVQDWTPRPTSVNLLEYIESAEECIEISHHFARTTGPSQDARKPSIEISSDSLPNNCSYNQRHEVRVTKETSGQVQINDELMELDPASCGFPQSSSTIIGDDKIKRVIGEDIKNMNMDWDFEEQSVPRPDRFDIPVSDSDHIESSNKELSPQTRRWEASVNSPAMLTSKTRQVRVRPMEFHETSKFRFPKPTKNDEIPLRRHGSGFEGTEPLNSSRSYQNKRVQWVK